MINPNKISTKSTIFLFLIPVRGSRPRFQQRICTSASGSRAAPTKSASASWRRTGTSWPTRGRREEINRAFGLVWWWWPPKMRRGKKEKTQNLDPPPPPTPKKKKLHHPSGHRLPPAGDRPPPPAAHRRPGPGGSRRGKTHSEPDHGDCLHPGPRDGRAARLVRRRCALPVAALGGAAASR